MIFKTPLDHVGDTPITYWGKYKTATLWIKEEGRNPTGSLKDRTAAAFVRDAVEKKVAKSVRFIDASSGSFACALGFFARLAGYEATVVVNSKISNDNLAFLKLVGAEIIRHGTVTGESRNHCLELIEKDSSLLFTDQLTNPLAPDVHAKTTAPEIFEDLPSVSTIIGSKGSGATLCGISRYVNENNHNTKIFGSIAIAGDEKKIAGTYLDGIDFASPFVEELAKMETYTGDVPVSYANAMKYTQNLLKQGFLVGPQGGGVFTAALEIIEKEKLTGDVVLITGDTLLKNVSRF